MDMKDNQKACEIAEKRMSMIAPLFSPNLDHSAYVKMREEISEANCISIRTLDRYCKQYDENGFQGLKPRGKCDHSSYKIPPELLEEAIQLRKELPSRSIPTLIQILELEGKAAPGFLKRTTLQDALQRSGYSTSMMKIYRDTGFASQRFQRVHRHDLWQGDLKYGPVLQIDGHGIQTYLSCLIDDCTRFILHAEFYGTMDQTIVEDTLKKAVIKYGAPRRLFFDNGSQYRTHWMKRACDLMGIRLLYARPRNPQGKGKQERFNHTVDAFLEEISLKLPKSLPDLNARFQAWLNMCYLSRDHSALGTTPEIAFKSDSMPPRYIASDILARAFLHCEPRKADKSGCISFCGKKYDLGITYAGQQVDVIYNPANIERLTIEASNAAPFEVHQLNIGEHVAPRPKQPKSEPVPVDRSRLLDAVSSSFEEKAQCQRRAISYRSAMKKEG